MAGSRKAKSKAKSTRARSSKESPDGTQLLTLELQEIHSAESQLSRLLPRLTKAVESPELQKSFEKRLSQGERLIGEIEGALEQLEASPGRKKNVAAEGLINDAREHVQEIERGPALDAVLIAAMQKTEHYCIAAWGTARALGAAAGSKAVVKSMERALQEGKQLDEALTKLAEGKINPQLFGGQKDAEDSSEDEEEEEDEEEDEDDADDADDDDEDDEDEDDEDDEDDDDDEASDADEDEE